MELKKFLNKYKELIIIMLFTIITLLLCYKYKQYILMLKNPNDFKNFIMSFGYLGIIVFVLFQFLQVVIFFIPGEVMQVAGGCIYGTILGSILSLIGITIGSILLFLLSRKYGRPLTEKFVPEKHLNSLENALGSKRLNLIVFLLYFLPGLPKDSTIMVCGISKISLKNFLIYSTLGRIPALVLSCYFGSSMLSCNKGPLIIMVIVIVTVFLIGLVKGDYLLKKLGNA